MSDNKFSMRNRIQRVLLCFGLFFISCEEPAPKTDFRIISLSPAMTEIIFALNAKDMLVGVTNYCDYPGAAKKKLRISDLNSYTQKKTKRKRIDRRRERTESKDKRGEGYK